MVLLHIAFVIVMPVNIDVFRVIFFMSIVVVMMLIRLFYILFCVLFMPMLIMFFMGIIMMLFFIRIVRLPMRTMCLRTGYGDDAKKGEYPS